MNLPKVSVHILSFNHEKYIEQCLLSVLEQDYENIEIVIGDDGSSDSTVDIIKRISCQHPGKIIPIIDCGHVGITENANRVLRKCTGEFIAVTGGDDYFLPGKIRKQVEWMNENSEAVLCGHNVLIKTNESFSTSKKCELVKEKNYGIAKSIAILGPPFSTGSIMYRSSAMPKAGYDIRTGLVSDWKLFLDVVGMNGQFGFINETLAVYRKHETSTTNLKKTNILEDVIRTLDLLEESNRNSELHSDISLSRQNAMLTLCTLFHQEFEYSKASSKLKEIAVDYGFSPSLFLRGILYKLRIPYSLIKLLRREKYDYY